MIQPVVVLGLGPAGTGGLREIARYTQQAYGSGARMSLFLAAFRPLPQREDGASDWIKTYSFPDFTAGTGPVRPALLRCRKSDAWGNITEIGRRRHVHANFLLYLQEHGAALLDLFKSGLQEFRSGGTAKKSTLQVHLLTRIDDVESVLLLDIANLALRALQDLKIPHRLNVHLALPSIWLDAVATPDGVSLAESFAFFRELERFTLNYRGVETVLYPHASGLAQYNAERGPVIDGLRVYAPALPDALASEWADVLLPQFERIVRQTTVSGFGAIYEQYNIVNGKSAHHGRIEQGEDRYGLYATAYEARSALFPLELMWREWTGRLAYQSLHEWLGQTPKNVASFAEEQLTAEIPTLGGDGEPGRRSPDILLHLMRPLGDANMRSGWDIEHVLFDSEAKKVYATRLRPLLDNYRADLDWQLSGAVIESYGIDRFHQRTVQAIEEQMQRYKHALDSISTLQIQRCRDFLTAYIAHQLVHPKGQGIRAFHALIKHLHGRLNENREIIKDKVRQHTQTGLPGHLNFDALRAAAGRVTRFRGIFGAETSQFRVYVSIAGEIMRVARFEVALRTLHAAAQQLVKHVTETYHRFDNWANVLWQDESSMLALTEARAGGRLSMREHPRRLWLYDPEWGEEMYQQHAAACIPQIHQMLTWLYAPQEENWQLHLGPHQGMDLRVSTRARRLITAQSPEENFRLWMNGVGTAVEKIKLSLWEDFFSPHDTYAKYLSRIVALLAQPKADWIPKPLIVTDDLIIPGNLELSHDVLTVPIEQALSDLNVSLRATHKSEDVTRILRYTAYEMLPVSKLPGYQQAMDAYQSLDRNRRSQLHALDAEREAVYWESEASHTLGHMLFPSSIVALLERPDAVKTFIWLAALGLIREESYTEGHKTVRRYALMMPSQQFLWLTSANSVSRLSAITAFIFPRTKYSVGIPPHQSESALPDLAMFDAWIYEAMQPHIHVPPNETAAYPENLRALRRILRGDDIALEKLTRAEILWTYSREMQNIRTEQDDERQLALLLYLIADAIHTEIVSDIVRNRVN